MIVEYKCTYKRVNDTIDKAKEDDREIDYIELTPAEWYAFHKAGDIQIMRFFEYLAATSTIYRGTLLTKRSAP